MGTGSKSEKKVSMNKGSFMKKKRILLMAAVLCISVLSGCGKNRESETVAAVQNKNYVYSFESFSDKFEDRDLSQNVVTQNRMIFMNYRYEEVEQPEARMEEVVAEPIVEEVSEEVEITEEVILAEEAVAVGDMAVDMPVEDFLMEEYVEPRTFVEIMQVDFEGNILAEFEIEQPANGGIHGMSADNNGNVYMALCEYGKDTSNPEMVRDVYTLLGYSENGDELFRVPIGEDISGEEYYYVNQILVDKEGSIFLWSTKGVEVYDRGGSFVKNISMESAEASTMYLLRDGSLAVLCYGDNNEYFKTVNIETGELSERIELPYNAYNYSHYSGSASDFILVDYTGVHTYNFGDEEPKKIMDFVDSDLASNTCYSVTQLSEDSFFAWTYDELNATEQCGIFTKVDPADIPDKKILTLGTQWLDTDVRTRVVEFNKNSTEYRIRVEDYNKYNTPEDYTAGATKLNTDIATGNAPDILCLTGDMPVESYMSKGLFADLNAFLENDPELKKEDYMTEAVEAFSWEGKWYQLVPSYYLFSVFGKTADVGEEPGWTFDELQMLRSKKGNEVEIFAEMTKSSIINYSMMFNSNQYINWETGECYFNTPEFVELLEFANEFPDEINYEDLYNDPDYWESQETRFRDGRALLMPYTMANFEDFVYCEQGIFGEQITAVGFPVREGVGSAFSCNQNFAISAKSDYQDVAWEFLRYYLTDEYQDELNYGWPIKLSSLDKKIEAAQKRPSYIDENGNTVEYDDTYYLNGVEIILEPLTQEDCDRVLSFIKTADHVYSYNNSIMMILEEECAAFFAGQKSAKEVADIIQSRIHIYVNENL